MAKEKVVSKWDDWAEEVKGFSVVKRGDETIKIPIKSISQETLDKINEKCRPPAPPVVPFVDPTTKKKSFIPNDKDEGYLKLVEELNERKTMLMVLAVLDIEVPGNTEDEKIANLKKKLPGDLVTIMRDGLILSNLLSLEEMKDEAKND